MIFSLLIRSQISINYKRLSQASFVKSILPFIPGT